jgi:hypothetical protein
MNHNNFHHWKVEYKTFNGAQGAITVRAGTSDDAKRITAEITRTKPDDVLDAQCVEISSPPSPRSLRGRH